MQTGNNFEGKKCKTKNLGLNYASSVSIKNFSTKVFPTNGCHKRRHCIKCKSYATSLYYNDCLRHRAMLARHGPGVQCCTLKVCLPIRGKAAARLELETVASDYLR